jgi:Domain of unknown function (DUF4386)
VTTEAYTGVLLVALPIMYNALYTMLARSFDYPNVLRRPTGEVLERFSAGGSRLLLTWWAFAMSAVLLAPTAVLVSDTLGDANATLLTVATAIGLIAAVVQFLGLIRWPFAVPHLAREMADPTSSESKKASVDVTFQTLNRYLGVAVGEHLGYLFTGAWTTLVGIAILESDVLHTAFGIIGLILGPLFVVGSFEFVGSNEPSGWKLAGSLVPIMYIGWSLWLLSIGVALLL